MEQHNLLTASEMDTLQRLERLPLSRFHTRLLLMGGLGYTFDAADAAVLAFILPSVATLFSLSNGLIGLLGSANMIGYFFGSLFAGILGDRFGRRKVMMYSLALYSVSSVLGACSPTFPFLFVTRVIAGIGTGAEGAIIAPFLAEFIQSKYRGYFLGSLAGFFSFGYVLAALLGYFVVPAGTEGWRVIQVLTALPIVMLLWWRRALPESPRWLIEQGRSLEADEVVSAMERESPSPLSGTLPTLTPEGAPSEILRRSVDSPWKKVLALWSPSLAKTTATLWILWMATTFAFYGFFTWIPTLLIKHGLSPTKSFASSFVIYLAQVPGYYSGAYLNEKLDRKWTILVYMLAGALSALLMANAWDQTSITVFGFILSFFMNGIYAGLYAYTPEVYPTAFRATGMGVASAAGRIGGVLAPLVIGFAFARIGFAGVFTITTMVLVLGAAVVAIVGIKTKGKTLEQIYAEELTGDHVD